MKFFESQDDADDGEEFDDKLLSTGPLRVAIGEENVRLVYFNPLNNSESAHLSDDKRKKDDILILRIDETTNQVTIYPFKTFEYYNGYLEPKYQKIREIIVDWNGDGLPETEDDVVSIIRDFPKGLIKDYRYGFGLLKDYRFIIHSIEKIDGISILLISDSLQTENKVSENTFILNLYDYHEIRKEVNRIARHGQSAIRAIKTFNVDEMLIKNIYKNAVSTLNLKGEFDEIEKLVESSLENRSKSYINIQQKKAVEMITKSSANIFRQNSGALIKLRQNIELVTLETLIEKFEQMIKKSAVESAWQKLFTNNPFILSLAFGFPVMLVQSQAYVGGGRIQGDGGKIADFLVKTKSTNNAAIFEIKTPQTKLVRGRAFREGVHGPSSDLSDAINQIGDQINKLLMNIYTIKVNSNLFDLESYSVQGVLIIGHTPDEPDKRKSLDLFRANIKNINILTFDELLEKLRQLHSFLCSVE